MERKMKKEERKNIEEKNSFDLLMESGSHISFFSVHSSLFIDLQWFSDDDDMPGKTEEPTEHKIRRLREEGQVVKSQEINGALGLLLPAMLLFFLAPSMYRTCLELITFFFYRAVELDPVKDPIIAYAFMQYFLRLTMPLLGVAVFAGLFSNIAQVGFLFTTKPLELNLSKVLPNFGKYFKQIFSVDGLYNFAKSLMKIAIIGIVSFIMIYIEREKLLNLQKHDVETALNLIATIAIRMVLLAAVLMLVLSIPDYFFQRWRFRERNKMTRYEVKQEFKEHEGDPQIQSRIRSRFRDLLKQNIATAVPQADVVITNPTHIAVAVQYDQSYMEGPMVVAMGAENIAAKIREIAEEHGVPLVENKPFARTLYSETKVGDMIPVIYWNTIASILNKVRYINEQRRRRGIYG